MIEILLAQLVCPALGTADGRRKCNGNVNSFITDHHGL